MSDIPNPIAILVYMRLDEFKPWLQNVLRDLIALWADAGTPELVGGSAAHTLILRRDALPIQCAQVRVQADTMFPEFFGHVEIEFAGDASTLPLFIAFLSAFANGLPLNGLYGSHSKSRENLRIFAAQYAKLLLPPTAKPIQAATGDSRMTKERIKRAHFFKSIKDSKPWYTRLQVASEANDAEHKLKEIYGEDATDDDLHVTEDDVRNDYRDMKWKWERGERRE